MYDSLINHSYPFAMFDFLFLVNIFISTEKKVRSIKTFTFLK